ncbi:hypothetical protein D3C72_1420120 [compost metagenome]
MWSSLVSFGVLLSLHTAATCGLSTRFASSPDAAPCARSTLPDSIDTAFAAARITSGPLNAVPAVLRSTTSLAATSTCRPRTLPVRVPPTSRLPAPKRVRLPASTTR